MSDSLQEGTVNQAPGGQRKSNGVPPMVIRYHSQAMARLARGSSVVVATLLAIPDSIALIPSSPTVLSWALKVLRVWLVALILWFVGFLIVLNLVKAFTRGLAISEDGLRLWRFGRVITWSQVTAVSIETQHLFSRLFSLRPPARRLTLFVRRKPGSRMAPQYIASFLFAPADFERMWQEICRTRFGFVPEGKSAVVCRAEELPELRRTFKLVRLQRAILTVLIAVGLVLFLGRKAAVNYLYADANRATAQGNYKAARHLYERVTALDPAFAAAWHNRARVEFLTGHLEKARQYWHRALLLKPDFVEPKVSLSYIYMQQRQFSKAADLLERALRIAPRNTHALVNLADLNMRLGHTHEAIKIAHLALTGDPDNHMANCLLAQARLRLGKKKEALALVCNRQNPGTSKFKESFCRLVTGEIYLALGNLTEAEQLFASVLKDVPHSVDALMDFSRLRAAQGNFQAADDLLLKAAKRAPYNPWPYLERAQLQLKLGDAAFAGELLAEAIAKPAQDARSLAFAAQLSLSLKKPDQAEQLARRSLQIEPSTPEARAIFDKLDVNKRRVR